MKAYKPDLNEKITLRLSVATKRALVELCRRNDLDESIIARTALEAGIQLAKEQGISAMMEAREKSMTASQPTQVKKNGETLTIMQKAGSNKWSIIDSDGNTLDSGTLYEMRPAAKKLCPPGGRVDVVTPSGVRERLA